MNTVPSKPQVLNLYRAILRYGRELELTDKGYFFQRIKAEFSRKKTLSDPELVKKAYEVRPCAFFFKGLVMI